MRSRGALLLLVAAAVARAGDPAEPAQDSIAAAKKDFATIKSLNSPADAKDALPSMDLKSVSPGPGAARPEAAPAIVPDDELSLDPSKKKDKDATGNWLVDAMAADRKSDRARADGSRDAAGRGDRDLQREPDRAGSRGEADAQATADSRERSAAKEPSEPVYNPLDAYMSGWISARDHDLLLPAAKNEGFAGGDPARARPGPSADGAPAEPEISFEAILSQGDAPAWSAPSQAPNPYLAGFDADPASPVKAFAPAEMPDFSPAGDRAAPASFGSQAGSLDASRSFIPDFAQPADDDKYFKQMKRF
jgi:hypothetical protein